MVIAFQLDREVLVLVREVHFDKDFMTVTVDDELAVGFLHVNGLQVETATDVFLVRHGFIENLLIQCLCSNEVLSVGEVVVKLVFASVPIIAILRLGHRLQDLVLKKLDNLRLGRFDRTALGRYIAIFLHCLQQGVLIKLFHRYDT